MRYAPTLIAAAALSAAGSVAAVARADVLVPGPEAVVQCVAPGSVYYGRLPVCRPAPYVRYWHERGWPHGYRYWHRRPYAWWYR